MVRTAISQSPTTGAVPVQAPRRPVRALFWRLFLINGSLFAAGTLLLAFSPVTVSSPVLLTEIPVLIVGLALILAANAALVRASLSPVADLATVMQRAELLRTDNRAEEGGNGEFEHLVRTFNEMLDRLEAEHTESSAHALAGQEGERERIARELHDEIGQSLTVALLSLKRVVDRAPASLREEVLVAQEAVRTSLDEVGQVAQRLRPGVLADLGLLAALTELCATFSRTSGIALDRDLDPEIDGLSSEVELVLYRVAQEGLTNVARHSGAARASLTLTGGSDGITLSIVDDGHGGAYTEGAGIRGMRERARLIGATLSVGPAQGGGTEVRLFVPDQRRAG